MKKQEISYDVSEAESVAPARKDGTSQQARLLKALDPHYFEPEDRGVAEWINYARAFSRVLKFPDISGKSTNWKSFLDRSKNEGESHDPAINEIIGFLKDPSSLAHNQENTEWFSRPHFVLFMTFLKLLEYSRDRINGFTQRHLDFYYKDMLQFRHAGARMDTVHAVVELEKNVKNHVLKRGTLLNAGKGPSGEDVHFEVTNDFFLNNARITSVRSVFLDREKLDLISLRLKYSEVVDEDFGMWPVFRLVYATPSYDDDLPSFPGESRKNKALLDAFAGVDQKVQANQEKIGLSASDFKMLMMAKANAIKGTAPWSAVDYWLSEAGRIKKGVSDFQLSGTTETNFSDQFKSAVGNIVLDGGESLDAYYQWMLSVEKYFLLPVEDAGFILSLRYSVKTRSGKQPSEEHWKKFYSLLERAYESRLVEARKIELHDIMWSEGSSVDERFMSMLRYALGDPNPMDPLPVYSSSLEKIYFDLQKGRDTRHEAYLRDELLLEPRDFLFLMSLRNKLENAEEWETGYGIIERAMRQKRRIALEKPYVDEWYNLYKSAEAPAIRSSDVTIGWKPFGMEGKGMKAEIGIVVSSPVLSLAEGNRKVVITLFFDEAGFEKDDIEKSIKGNPFIFKMSTAAGFQTITADKTTLVLSSTKDKDGKFNHKLIVTLMLDATQPPVEAIYAEETEAENLPAIQLILREQKDGKDTRIPYAVYRKLQLQKVDISIEVSGVKTISAENDNGTLNLKKPFEPFGSAPLIGSRFYFVNKEIVNKKLSRLTFNFEWMGKPDLNKVYKDYPYVKDKKFTASLVLAENNSEFRIGDKIEILSDTAIIDVENQIKQVNPRYDHRNVYDPAGSDDIQQSGRYFFLELNDPDFQHTEYPILLQEIYQKKAADKTDQTPLPKPPYTPKLKAVTVDYASDVSISFHDDSCGVISYLHPFGTEKITEGPSVDFLPSYEDEGSLYIGIEELNVPDTISLFFQIFPNSADPDVLKPQVEFSYLGPKGWRRLSAAAIIQDTTLNLAQSGVVQLIIPEDATNKSSIIGAGKYWVKLSVVSDSNGINDFLDVRLQGIEAVKTNHGQYWSIPVGTIQSTVNNVAAIKNIQQPYSSFGGLPVESNEALYTRISERLRHKQRAVNVWDYERLVLNIFPDIYKVKAIPAGVHHKTPRVVVIPKLSDAAGINLFEPRLPQSYLLKIQDFLRSKASAFSAIKVMNPRYQQVKVRVSVRLRRGYNESLCREQLNTSIQRFLSPWAFDTNGEVTFGGIIYANAVVNFLEREECVEYIVGLKFFTSDDSLHFSFVTPDPNTNTNMVVASETDTILVSAPAHEIDIISDDKIDYDDLNGIGYLKIELDFKVN